MMKTKKSSKGLALAAALALTPMAASPLTALAAGEAATPQAEAPAPAAPVPAIPAADAPAAPVPATPAAAGEGDVAIDAENFPDENFRKCIKEKGYDTNADGTLQAAELENVTEFGME
ncbi:MAG: hypothetical protein RR794_05130, partial [Raoultibacter sp.]